MRHHPSLREGPPAEPTCCQRLAWSFLAISGVAIVIGLSPLGERAGWPLVLVMLGALGLSLGCYFIHSVQVATRGGAALWKAQAGGVEFPMPAARPNGAQPGRSENPN